MRKIFISLGLFALSWWTLAWLGNAVFATALLGLLTIHEAGHLAFMWRYGVPLRGLYFIPLLGAFIVPGGRLKTRSSSVAVSLGGPLFGLTSAIGALIGYALWPSEEAASVAYIAAAINFFNMLPVYPLDGGQALAAAIDENGRPHAKIATTMWVTYFLGIGFMLIALESFVIAALLAFYGYQGITSFLTEIGRREDREAIRAALSEAFGVTPDAVADAAEAPLARHQNDEDPAFPEGLMRERRALHEAEGLRRIEWCIPEDSPLSDEDADAWGATLDAHLERNAARTYEHVVAETGLRVVPARKIGPFGSPKRLTDRDELDPYAPLGLPSPLRRYLSEDDVTASAPDVASRNRLAFVALAVALAGCLAVSGFLSDWSFKGLL